MKVADFPFVRKIAAEHPSFTIPPLYVLWLLLKVRKSVCLITELNGVGPVGYLIAVPVEPAGSLFVWQLAVTNPVPKDTAVLSLLEELRNAARRMRVRRISFSTLPKSAAYRSVRRYARVFGVGLTESEALPSLVAPNEREYWVELPIAALESPRRKARRSQRH